LCKEDYQFVGIGCKQTLYLFSLFPAAFVPSRASATLSGAGEERKEKRQDGSL